MKIFKKKERTPEQEKKIRGVLLWVVEPIVLAILLGVFWYFGFKAGEEAGKKLENANFPIVFETICAPEVDTLMTYFADGQRDTSYRFIFQNIIVE